MYTTAKIIGGIARPESRYSFLFQNLSESLSDREVVKSSSDRIGQLESHAILDALEGHRHEGVEESRGHRCCGDILPGIDDLVSLAVDCSTMIVGADLNGSHENGAIDERFYSSKEGSKAFLSEDAKEGIEDARIASSLGKGQLTVIGDANERNLCWTTNYRCHRYKQ